MAKWLRSMFTMAVALSAVFMFSPAAASAHTTTTTTTSPNMIVIPIWD